MRVCNLTVSSESLNNLEGSGKSKESNWENVGSKEDIDICFCIVIIYFCFLLIGLLGDFDTFQRLKSTHRQNGARFTLPSKISPKSSFIGKFNVKFLVGEILHGEVNRAPERNQLGAVTFKS